MYFSTPNTGVNKSPKFGQEICHKTKEAPSNFIIRQTVPQLDVYLGAQQQYGLGLSYWAKWAYWLVTSGN